MEIAALVSFAALFAAWIVAPDHPREADVAPTLPAPEVQPAAS